MNNVFEFLIKNAQMKERAKTIESFAMTYYQPGSIFYSHKQDKDITAIASYYHRKIKTERMFALDADHTRIETLTKVTFL